MFRKILFGIVISSILLGGMYWFFYTKQLRTPISEGIKAIPMDAAIVFESKQSKNTWKKISQTNIMWEALLDTETFSQLNKQGTFIDSILQTAPEISQLLDGHSIYISAHETSNNHFDLLYAFSLPNLTYKRSVEDFFEKKITQGKLQKQKIEFEGETITSISSPLIRHFYFSVTNGIVVMSSNHKLIEASIHQLKSGVSLTNINYFSKIINTAGENVDATIYINYKKFPDFISPALFPADEKTLAPLTDFADCSSWDISIKPNALILSGFTSSSDSSNCFLNLFRKQKPQETEVTSIIPANTSMFLFLGMSNIKSFHQDYKKYLKAHKQLQEYNTFCKKINDNFQLDIESLMLRWIDNEMALVITESETSDFTPNSFEIIRSNNIIDAVQVLNQISDATKNKETKTDSTSYKSHPINQLNIPDLLPQLLGKQFNKIKSNFYAPLDNYIVFANTSDALKSFIDKFESNKTLSNDKHYLAFSENISTESNVFLYNAIARSKNTYSAFIKEELVKELELKEKLLKKFEALAIQFSSTNKLFYSNIYLKYNPEQKQETSTLWETKLESNISKRPYLLSNHNTKAKDVFVQDDANKIYLISNTGKIIWTKQLPEKIMSDVIQVDALKNDKLQMIFNTRSFIYMFDRNGNDMKGFPIKLRSPATNSITITDYEQNREYRIFIATENKRIVCYKSNGEQLTAFKFDKTSEQIFMPVLYFRANNKDHLCAIDVKGNIYMLNRQGEIRIKLKEKMELGIRNFYVESGKDYAKTFIIAADTIGNIIKISFTDHKESIKIQDFETSPYFDLKDINNDKSKEYIFLSRNKLKVFSQDKTLLFNYEFPIKIAQAPSFFKFPDGSCKIGVVSDESNEIFLFNENGSLFNSFPLNGKTMFSIGDLNNEGSYNLVTGSSENSIFMYQLKKFF
jgi:hypothetical protein